MVQPVWTTVWHFLKWLNRQLSYDPANSTPRNSPERNKSMCPHKNLYMNVHSNIIHNRQKMKQPKWSSTDKWMTKMGQTHTTEFYSSKKRNEALIHATTWTVPGNIMLSEKRQKGSHKTPHIVWFHLYEMSRIGTSLEVELNKSSFLGLERIGGLGGDN